MCVPTAALVHAKEYGLLRSSPSFVVPLKNSTLVTVPLASAAVAVIEIEVPTVTRALFAGAVIATVGAVLAVTVMFIAVDVVVALELSVALAVTLWAPAVALFQVKV